MVLRRVCLHSAFVNRIDLENPIILNYHDILIGIVYLLAALL